MKPNKNMTWKSETKDIDWNRGVMIKQNCYGGETIHYRQNPIVFNDNVLWCYWSEYENHYFNLLNSHNELQTKVAVLEKALDVSIESLKCIELCETMNCATSNKLAKQALNEIAEITKIIE